LEYKVALLNHSLLHQTDKVAGANTLFKAEMRSFWSSI